MKLSIRQADGTEKLVNVDGAGLKLHAQPGATYRPIDEKTAKTPKTAVVKRVHDDLVLENGSDGSAVTVEKFFSDCSPTDRCWAVLDAPGASGSPVTITQEGDPLAALLGGNTGSMADGQALSYASSSDLGGAGVGAGLFGLGESGALIAGGAGLAVLGLAAGGGGGGGGGGSTSTPTGGGGSGGGTGGTNPGALTIKGVIAAGPMKAGTIEVLAYDKDGKLLGTAVVKSDSGDYEIVAAGKGAYTGPVVLVAHDIDPNAATNFVSEATGQLTNLVINLGAVGSAPGNLSTIVINITPLTQLAALKLGVDVNATGALAPVTADAAQVAAVNTAIGKFFGVNDILGAVTTINDPSFRALAGSDAWSYGVALAKLSVLDAQYGSVAAALAHLDGALTMANGALVNTDPALANIATSLTIAGDFNSNAAAVVEAAKGNPFVNIAAQPNERVVFALPVNAVAGDVVHLSLAGPSGTATAGTYTVTADDVIAGFASMPVPLGALASAGTGTVQPMLTFTDAQGANASAPVADTPFQANVVAPQPVLTGAAVQATPTQPAGLDVTVSYAGMAAGDTVQIEWDGQNLGAPHTITAADVAAGSYTVFVPGTTMDAAGGSYTATVTNTAGNPGEAAAMPIPPDATGLPPTTVASFAHVSETTGPLTGDFASGTSTDGRTPQLGGDLSAPLGVREVLSVYDGTTLLGQATVNGTTWSFTSPSLALGSHSLTLVVENPTFNVQGTASSAFVVNEQAITLDAVTDAVGLQQGMVAAGGTTDDSHPALSGTLGTALLASGEVVAVYDGAVKLGNAVVSGTGWRFTPTAALADGTHSFTAVIEDGAGTSGERVASGPFAVTIDTSALPPAPTQTVVIAQVSEATGPVTGAFASGTSTDGSTPTLSGSVSAALGANEVIAVYDGATLLGNATVSGTGWSFTTPALALGSHGLTVVVQNTLFNTQGTASSAFVVNEQAITLDAVVDAVGPLQGTVAAGGTLDDSRPALSGSLGSASLGSGEVVAVYDGAVKLGNAVVSGTGWSFTPAVALADGAHSFTAVIEGAGGALVASSAIAVTVDTAGLPPTQTVTIAQVTEATGPVTGAFASGTSTDSAMPTLSGSLSAALIGSQYIAVYDGSTLLGHATVSGSSWSFTTPALALGGHSLTVVVENPVSNTQGPVSAPFVVNEQAIFVAGVIDAQGLVQGAIAASGQTDDTTPTITGSLGSALLGAGEAVVIYDGSTRLGVATVNGTGWSFTPGAALADGPHSWVAVIEDAATGTAGTGRVVSAAQNFSVQAIAPVPTTLATIDAASETSNAHGSVTGAFASGTSTDGSTPLLSGSLSATLVTGEVVSVYDGSTLLGQAAVSGMAWTFTTPSLGLGSHALTAVVENVNAGTHGTASAAFVVAEQSIALGTLADAVGAMQGSVSAGGFTDDSRPVLTGTLGVAQLGANEVVAVYDGSVKLGVATVSGTAWSFTPSTALVDGAHSLVAMIQDSANISLAGGRVVSDTIAFTLDTSGLPPTQSATIVSATDNVATHGSQTGTVANGTSTDDTTPSLAGNLSAALVGSQVVAVYDTVGGVPVRLGTAVVVGTQWSFDTPALGAGTHSLTAVVENATNGAQGPATAAFVVNEQSIAITNVIDDTGLLQGPIANGGFTDDARPTLNGTLGAATLGSGEVVAVYDGTTRLGTAVVTGSSWSFTPGTPLADGAHSLRAMVEDSAGTAADGRAVSGTIGFTVLTVLSTPTTVATIAHVSENTGPLTGDFASGTSTDGRTPTLSGSLGAPLGLGEVVAVYDGTTLLGNASVSGTSWSFTTPTLATGSHGLTVVVQNLVSNTQGPVSATFVVNEQSIAALGVYDDVGAVQGQVAAGGVTDDARPTFSGVLGSAVLGANEVVAVYDGAVRIGTASISGAAWSFTPAADLGAGAHQLVAMVQDSANTDPAAGRLVSSAFTFSIDTSALAPTQTVTIGAVVDSNGANGSATGAIASGSSTDDTTPAISGTLSAALTAGQTIALYDNGVRLGDATVVGTTWSFATPTLGGGTHSLVAVAENTVNGAQGTPSTAFVLTEQSIAVSGLWDDVGLVQGNLLAGGLLVVPGLTDDSRPTFSGTLGQGQLGAGEVVAIYDGATRIGNATVSGNSWSFTPGVALADGSHSLRAMVQDDATGTALNGRVVSASTDFVLLTPLYAPVSHATITSVSENTATNGSAIGAFASGTSTDGRTPTLSGTLDVALSLGDSLAVYDGAAFLGNAVVNGTNWSFTTPALGNGSHSLTVTAVNAVTGASGTPSAAFTLVAQGLTVTSLIDDVGASTGAIAPNASTDDARPTFSGTLASATLGANELLAVYDGNTRIGVATQTGTGWSFTPAGALADGAHNLRVMIQDIASTDPATGRVVSTASAFTVDTSAVVPTQLASITAVSETTTSRGSLSGTFASGTSTDGRTPMLTGAIDAPLAAGQVVAVYDGGVRLGTATVSGTGWTYTTPSLAIGAHSLTAQVENAASGAHAPASTAFTLVEQSVGIDSLLANLVNGAVQVAVGGVLGVFVGTTPAFTGTLGSASLGAGEAVALYDGNTKLGEAIVTGATWSFTPVSGMSTGIHHVSAMIQPIGVNDSHAGRVVSAGCDFTIDLNVSVPTQLIAVTGVLDTVGTNGSTTGNVAAGTTTDATTPVISGTLSSGLLGAQVVAVYDGTTKLGNAVVNGTNWSFTTDTPLALGGHVLTAQVQNPVSLLQGLPSLGYGINVQTIGGLSVYDDIGTIRGNVAQGGVTDDNHPTLYGTLGSATLGLGEVVMVYDTVGGVTTQLGAALQIGTTWSFTPLLPMADGTHHLTAMVEPLIGGTASNGRVVSGGVDFTIDTSLPPLQLVGITSVTDTYALGGSKTGTYGIGAVIDDGKPVISGSLSGALVGAQAVAVYDTAGGVTTKIGYATIDPLNALHWSLTPALALAAGGHALFAQVENTATGSNGLASIAFGLTERPITLAIGDNVGAVQGDVLGFGNATTDDSSLALTGTIGTPLLLESVKVYDNGVQIGTASVSGNNWSFNANGLTAGSHAFAVHIENLVGGFTVATGATVTVTASDPLVTTTDTSLNGSALAKLSVGGSATTIDLTLVAGAQQPHTDVIDLGQAANTLKIGYADVLQAHADSFTSATGWTGLGASGRNQLLVEGGSGTVTMTDSVWVAVGTTTHAGTTYNVYNDALHNAQLLVDAHLSRTGPIGG